MSEKNMNWEFLANKDYAFLTEDPALGDVFCCWMWERSSCK